MQGIYILIEDQADFTVVLFGSYTPSSISKFCLLYRETRQERQGGVVISWGEGEVFEPKMTTVKKQGPLQIYFLYD